MDRVVKMKILAAVLMVVLLTFLLSVPFPLAVQAQSGIEEIRVYGVDISQFPRLQVRVAPLTQSGELYPGLKKENVFIREDSVNHQVDSVNLIEEGVLVAIVLDASGSINAPGATGKLRREEAIEAIDDLVMTDKWLDRKKRLDWVLLMVPRGKEKYEIIQDWTNDYVRIHNQAYVYDFQSAKTDTPLYAMLVDVIRRMKDAPNATYKAKFILVLSDGIDRASAEQIEDVINRAHDSKVTILSVKLGPKGTGEAKNLRRLARLTGGSFTIYNGIDTLIPLYKQIRSQRQQYSLSYQSAINQSGKHTLGVIVNLGKKEITSDPIEFGLTVLPPKVEIVEPKSGTVIDRVSDRWDVDPRQIEPREYPVTLKVSWPDGHPRDIVQISYIVNGVVIATLSPKEPFVWNLSDLKSGVHVLTAEVKDELGLIGRSEPSRVTINVKIPPTPTPTPMPSPTPVEKVVEKIVEERTTPITFFSWFSIGLAAGAILLALFVYIKRPQVIESMASGVTGIIKEVTEIFVPSRGATGETAAHAYLIPIHEDGRPGDPIPIRAQSVLLGRDPARAHIVFPDRTVSRLHARIVEEQDGVFYIYDEGSTSGTYVNYEQVTPKGRQLVPGDEIEMGRVRLIFQTNLDDDLSTTEAFTPRGNLGETDILEEQ